MKLDGGGIADCDEENRGGETPSEAVSSKLSNERRSGLPGRKKKGDMTNVSPENRAALGSGGPNVDCTNPAIRAREDLLHAA